MVENSRFGQRKVSEGEIQLQKIRNRRKSIRYCCFHLGIRTNMPKRDDEELKKVTQMVKEKNYKHKELAVLRQDDIIRMKVTPQSLRKLSANLPRKSRSSRGSWRKRKRSKS
jgi:hypothetical protein